jgi:hypothetical protein
MQAMEEQGHFQLQELCIIVHYHAEHKIMVADE